MDSRLLTLLQLCDSNFPSGAFSHSFGLETYIQDGRVHNKATFARWLQTYLQKQLVCTDGLVCRLCYEALEQNRIEDIWQLDQLVTVQNSARESREASRRMGERMIRLGMDLFSIASLNEYEEKLRAKYCFGHPAIVFTIIAYHLTITKQDVLLSFLYSSMATLVQNGVRGIPLGQTDGQRLLLELQPFLLQAAKRIQTMDSADLGVVSPGLEISQMQHERLNVRLFMS
ncbi:urease accessory protein UreF [Aneurinibacillus sp. Ricciae_BoGa-3]|uniref:urease accessory protein UreF n=1 Tax=Aneurinibacillus sp. Ricciae_BoGa-3 TaxID=3022697 RepID=UPI00234200EA|nr:urease accessory protein UreF [Aneurinibacillus sp. Ricciae_BoGa-3]WCK53800.1 urease accessory protein UreF [Aneurinibacillus sp. Ricciae_BoGa-3]